MHRPCLKTALFGRRQPVYREFQNVPRGRERLRALVTLVEDEISSLPTETLVSTSNYPGWAVVAHALNPSTWEAEAGGSLYACSVFFF